MRCRWCPGCDPKGEVLQCLSLAPSTITSSFIWESERSRSASILITLMLRSLIWKESSYRKLSGFSPAFFANTAVRCDWRVPSEGGLGRLTLAVEVGCFPRLDSADCSVAEVAAVAAGRYPACPLALTLAVAGVDVMRGPGCWRDSRRSSQAALLLLSLSCLLGFRSGWPSSFSWWLDTLMLLLL